MFVDALYASLRTDVINRIVSLCFGGLDLA